ncbi:lysis protein [Candidatus Symbiopectobacterium endolongispinus]|uniref:lysis protein n=1 Tax=Candidatus Symbiopectobacterium endolongispinus TaxID=2812664 RepID=UPI003F68580B|nr:lysis protein [Candidatus Symbiopectobacterium endolongispinus]
MRPYFHAALAAIIAALSFGVYYYHDAYSDAANDLALAKDTIADLQTRQRDVAALDAKYTKELSDAKKAIGDLHRDVAAGRKRLLISATCSTNPTTSSVVNAGASELNPDSRRIYFLLREQLITTEN